MPEFRLKLAKKQLKTDGKTAKPLANPNDYKLHSGKSGFSRSPKEYANYRAMLEAAAMSSEESITLRHIILRTLANSLLPVHTPK